MKQLILILSCLTLSTAAGLADDFHMVIRQVFDGSEAQRPNLYVLLLPNHNPVIFKNFDSKEMENVIGTCLPSGSVLRLDPDPELERPTDVQIQSLKDYCKKKGISLVVSSTA